MSQVTAGQSLWTGPVGDHHRYRVDLQDGVLQSVGDGGEGLVYRAVRERDGVDVALKMLTSLTLDDYSLVEERARVMAEIDHPNVMHQLETFIGTALVDVERARDDDFDIVYTVAEWIAGVPLAVGIEAAGPVAGLRWVGQIARAVASLHAFRGPDAPNGVIHRDIKPSNVRIFQDRAVLIDFGIARAHDTSDLTQGAGTYLWRAPEVLGGPGSPGPASDVWGIGALAHWVLLSEPPRLEGAAAARERLVPAARDAGIHDPASTARHIAALLETNPDDRPTDINRWADQLERLTAGARQQSRAKKPTANRNLRRGMVLGTAIAAIAAVAVGLVIGIGGGDEAPGKASPSLPTNASPSASVPKHLTAAMLRSNPVALAPIAAGTYRMSGTRTDTQDSNGSKPLTQTETYDAVAAGVDAVQHQVVRGQQSDGQNPIDYSKDRTFDATGVYVVHQSYDQPGSRSSWDWSPKVPDYELPLRVGASWTYSSEGTVSDTDGVRRDIRVSGRVTVTDTEDVMVNGTSVATFVIEGTQTSQSIETDESNQTTTVQNVEVDTYRQWLSPEYGLIVKSHQTANITGSEGTTPLVYVLTDDLSLESTSPS